MFKVGLTGGIGSGKTTVAQIFEVLKVPVLYADDIAKDIMHTNASVKQQLIENYGEDLYQNEILNKALLASIVFSDEAKLKVLNSIVHPPTIAFTTAWMDKQNSDYLIKEAAILFESGSNSGLDFIIGVEAPDALRIKRVMLRDGVNEESVKKRMAKQMPQEEKMKKCDVVILNDGKTSVLEQVLHIHDQILKIAL